MTTRKPKLDLLYVQECFSRRLQLAVVTPTPQGAQQHAKHWQAARILNTPSLPTAPRTIKH